MAEQNEVLRVLSTKEEATSPQSLASELKAGEATVRTYLNRLKKKGYVDGGGSLWYITDAGKAALERVEEIPTTKEDVGEDELSKFKYYGELSGVPPDKVIACTELFQNTNMRSMDEMGRVLAEMNIPQNQQTQWKNLYRGYLRNTTAPEQREELYPLPVQEEVKLGEEVAVTGERKGERMDYIVEGNDILRVGDDLGMFTFRQALQVVAAKRGTVSQPGSELGTIKDLAAVISTLNPNQPITLADVLTIVKTIDETRGEGGSQSPPGSFVDDEGNVQELKPGQPIVIKKVIREPSKTVVVRQTAEGIVTEEYEVGKPIIISAPPSSSNLPGMVPFPVFGEDGKAVYDTEGKPVYANLEPMMKFMGFQSEQRRADERHDALMGIAQAVRENFGDGIAALKAAAGEMKGSRKEAPKEQEQQQVYECGDCHTQFAIPDAPFETVKCPNPECGRVYTKEEVLSS